MYRLTKEEHNKRLELYNAGLTDAEIGAAVYVGRKGICNWRKMNKLPANFPRGRRRKTQTLVNKAKVL